MARTHWELALDTIYPSAEKLQRALSARPLRVYIGLDITGPTIHIGHGSTLRILRDLQDQGHHVILLFGDFTALVGDPTGKDVTRPLLSTEDIEENQRTYTAQLPTILDIERVEFRSNSEWYRDQGAAGTLEHFLRSVGTHFTVQQLWERDMFQERQRQGRPVTVTEFLYPMLQAYDSIMLDADVELGATDQTFNMLAGRDLARKVAGKEKFVITTTLLRGTDGRKMSKSYGNYIGVTDPPADMFGKLMSVRDELLNEYFALAAGIDPAEPEIAELITTDPRSAKARMALEVTTLYHGAPAAEEAARAFDRQFRDKEGPGEIPGATPTIQGQQRLTAYLVDLGLAASNSEASRLIEQGAVAVDGTPISDPFAEIGVHHGMVLRVGKRQHRRIELTDD